MRDSSQLEELYRLVNEAIPKAELLEDLGAPGASDAYLDVSLIEEEIAKLLPADTPEGAIARRGAVHASLSAGQYTRALKLAQRFESDPAAGVTLRRTLRALVPALDKERHEAVHEQTVYDIGLGRFGSAPRRPTIFVASVTGEEPLVGRLEERLHSVFPDHAFYWHFEHAIAPEESPPNRRIYAVHYEARFIADAMVLIGTMHESLQSEATEALWIPSLAVTIDAHDIGRARGSDPQGFHRQGTPPVIIVEWLQHRWHQIVLGSYRRGAVEFALKPFQEAIAEKLRAVVRRPDAVQRLERLGHDVGLEAVDLIEAVGGDMRRFGALSVTQLNILRHELGVGAPQIEGRDLTGAELAASEWSSFEAACLTMEWPPLIRTLLLELARAEKSQAQDAPYARAGRFEDVESWTELYETWQRGGLTEPQT